MEGFVGREEELAALGAAVGRAVAGTGGLALIAGEPGIGKTTLAAEAAALAAAQGAEVHWGRCVELEGAPVYWCWRQAIRSWAEARDVAAVHDAVGADAVDISRMVPEVGSILALDAPAGDEDDDARFRMFDAVVRWLQRASRLRPVVLVLEDLHWADAASLRLLEYAAGNLADTRALVLGTFRDAEAAPGTPLEHALGALRRGRTTSHLALTGLSEADVAALAQAAHGLSLEPDAAAAVREHTGGNPFFVAEVLRLLAAEDHLGDAASLRSHVPPSVRAVILRRIRQLRHDDAERILTLAGVVGARFDAGTVAALAGGRADALDAVDKVLGEAVALALVAEDDGGPDRYRFVHALVREALYEQIPRADKPLLHRAAGEALEAAAGDDPDALAALAAHFLAAAPTGVAPKAIHYARAAAAQAAGRLAHEEAIALSRAALELSPARDAQRADLLHELGLSCFSADEPMESRRALLDAAGIAAEVGDPVRMARSLLAVGSGRFRGAAVWNVPVDMMEENLRLLGDSDDGLRAQLLSRMADMVADRTDAFRLLNEAVALAREVDDPDVLALTLTRRFLSFIYADSIEERERTVEELLANAARCVDRQRAYDARALHMRLLFEKGDLDGGIAAARRLDDDVDTGRGSLLFQMSEQVGAMVAIARGEFEEAQRLLMGLLVRAGERGGSPLIEGLVQIQLLAMMREQEMFESVGVALGEAAKVVADDPNVHLDTGVLLVAAELGRVEEAKRLLHHKVGPDLMTWAGSWGGHDTVELVWTVEACGILGDGTFAARLYELLAPARDRFIVASMAPVMALGWGTYPLAIAAALLERHDEADALFAEALARHEAMRLPTLVARTKAHWDRARSRRGASADGAVFRRDGEFWTVAFEGSTAQLKDTKGMRHLAELLASPGAERHVLDLVGADDSAGGDAGPVLDAQAKASYRRRVAELTEERDEAAAANDLGRAERAEDELEAILAQLRGAVGLGGRDRRAAAAGERARISVSRSVKSAVARIDEALPALAAHLRATVRTGTYCSYTPDPRAAVAWEV